MPELSMDVTSGSSCVITLTGEIDSQFAPVLKQAGVAAVVAADGAGRDIVVDLAMVTFMDSTGLGALIAIRNAAVEAGSTLSLRGMQERVAKLLAITGLTATFGLDEREVPASSS